MERGAKMTHSSALDLPDGFDPSGIPYLNSGRTETPLFASHRVQIQTLPGLAPTSVIAAAAEVAEEGDGEWLVWGSVGDRPVLFAAEPGAAAEMMRSVAAGEVATAIVEPCQVVLERLD